jgi:hypothetical protein
LLEGPAKDLKDWEDQLPAAFDPWVEVDRERHVLHSVGFEQFSSSDGVDAYATWLVRVLAGAIAVQVGITRVTSSGLVQYLPDGKRIYTARVDVRVTSRARAYSAPYVTLPDGSVRPVEPTPSQPQKWAATAAGDPFIADALSFLGGARDWFDIYKALESLELKYGGERGLLEKGWADLQRVKLLKRTANAGPRHPERKIPPPDNPMPLSEARGLVGKLIVAAMSDKS